MLIIRLTLTAYFIIIFSSLAVEQPISKLENNSSNQTIDFLNKTMSPIKSYSKKTNNLVIKANKSVNPKIPPTTNKFTIDVIDKTKLDSNLRLIELQEQAYKAYSIGLTEVAVKFYLDILKITKADEKANFGLALIYQQNNLFDQAKNLYIQILTHNSNHQASLNNLLALIAIKSPHLAIEELKKLKTINLNSSIIPAQMAIIYYNLGNYQLAINLLQQAVNLEPTNLNYLFNLAIILDKAKKKQEAIEVYKKLLTFDDLNQNKQFDLNKIKQRIEFLTY